MARFGFGKFEELDGYQLIQVFEDVNEIHRYEGESGVRNLETLVRALDDNYRDLQDFLADNPGACSKIVEWIEEWVDRAPEWRTNLIQSLRDSGEFCSDCDQSEEEANPECSNPAHQAGSILAEDVAEGGTDAE